MGKYQGARLVIICSCNKGTIPPADNLLSVADQWNVSPELENSGNPLTALVVSEAYPVDYYPLRPAYVIARSAAAKQSLSTANQLSPFEKGG